MTMFNGLPKFIFFTGKGGVGKTSLACATALEIADSGLKVLLVSTDPASNVGQVFDTKIGNRITPINGVDRLEALEINPQQAAATYRERIVGPMLGKLPDRVLRSIEEQLSGACTTEIAAFDEFTGLLTDAALIDAYEHIVFDTAPTGHTIRLLQLPGAWTEFLEEGRGDASCLGPLAGLDKQRERYAAAVGVLSDATMTRLVLVARSNRSALAEAARTSKELAAIGLRNQQLAINGVMPIDTGNDLLAGSLAERDRFAMTTMDPDLAKLSRSIFELRAENLVGIDALRRFTRGDDGQGSAPTDQQPLSSNREFPILATLIDELERSGKGLVMFMGKGGVGKTTLAAAVAVALASRGHEVLLTTTDPAAHLTATLDGSLPHLTVSRIDPEEETARYRADVLETKGRALDDDARAMLEEDLRSPCTEEIAVFQAFSRVVSASVRQFVIVDTAPTGHTLLLLDATGAYHRDIVRHSGRSDGNEVSTPMMQIQDPNQTKMLIVTLPETTPVLEAENLQEDLRRANIEPWAWVVNGSVAAATTSNLLLARRALAELTQIEKVKRLAGRRYAVVPIAADEPIGPHRLLRLVDAQPNRCAA